MSGAYGKDPSQLAGKPSFRQSAQIVQSTRPKSTGSRRVPTWVNRYQPSLTTADKVRVLKGSYQVPLAQPDATIVEQTLFYFPYTEHFHGTMKKSCVCSAGPLANFKNLREPCKGCDMFWEGRSHDKRGPMSKRDLFAFTVLHYGDYAHVPQLDRNGQPRVNDAGQPYREWKHFLPHERNQYAQYDQRNWNVMHWSVGTAHYQTLLEYDKLISMSCSSCSSKDSIVSEAWVCRNCEETIVEPATSSLSPAEIDQMTLSPCRCTACGHEDYLFEYISCTNCPNARRAELFDVDLTMKRVAPADGGNQTSLLITSWSNPQPIDERLIEVAVPLPLDQIFAPTPYEAQETLFGGGGYAAPSGAQHSRPYQKRGPEY